MILDKALCKKIEYYLCNYEIEHEQLEIIEEDVIWGCKTGVVQGGSNNDISSKTEKSAMKLLELEKRQAKDKQWLEVIESVLHRFKGTEYENLIEFTYKQQYRLPKILRLMNMEKTAYYDKRNDIIMYAALKATEKGLIKH
jgi:RinA family phage transcriptional activator